MTGNTTRVLTPLLGLGLAALGFLAVLQLQGHRSVQAELSRLRVDVDRMERAMQLFRVERQSHSSLGIAALLEQLKHWAPQAGSAATPTAELPAVTKRIDDLMRAIGGLGSEATAALESEFRRSQSGEDDEYRKWVLKAVVACDRRRGVDLLVQCLRGLSLPVSARIREFAADQLIELDKPSAAAVLREILSYESVQGVSAERIPRAIVEERPEILMSAQGRYPGFHNFVTKYGETDDPELVPTLAMLLGRHEHDLPSIQQAVKLLGQAKSKAKDAAPRIRELFQSPPEISDNPIFRNHCLDALVAIEGRELCGFIESVLRQERNELVLKKLNEIRNTLCR